MEHISGGVCGTPLCSSWTKCEVTKHRVETHWVSGLKLAVKKHFIDVAKRKDDDVAVLMTLRRSRVCSTM